MDHLLVNLHLDGQREPILCIPHGSGGLMSAREPDRLSARIEHANDGGDADVWLHLARHAHGLVSAHGNLRGATFTVASEDDRAIWTRRCVAHRASADKDRSGTEHMPLACAIEMAASLDRCGLPGYTLAMMRVRYTWDEPVPYNLMLDRAIRDGLILCSVSPVGDLRPEDSRGAREADAGRPRRSRPCPSRNLTSTSGPLASTTTGALRSAARSRPSPSPCSAWLPWVLPRGRWLVRSSSPRSCSACSRRATTTTVAQSSARSWRHADAPPDHPAHRPRA